MNFQQLRSIQALTRHGYSLTEVASVSNTSQPGISRQIRDLEQELDILIFERAGKRIVGLSEAGKSILSIINRLLSEADNLKRASLEYTTNSSGVLTVATTHTQARYALPNVVLPFLDAYADVRIALQQSTPEDIARWVVSGVADIGIASEGLGQIPELVSFACYRWRHQVLVPDGHPLLALATLRLEDLARYPLITYDTGFTGRGHIDDAFRAAGLRPDIVLTAMDSDVIKQYVELGMGVGLLAPMAYDAERDTGLRLIDASTLFAATTTRLAVRRGAYLRSYTYAFILRFAPHLTRADIDHALQSEWRPDGQHDRPEAVPDIRKQHIDIKI